MLNTGNRMAKRTRQALFLRWIGVAVLAYLILLIPDPPSAPPMPAARRPFIWNQDARWDALESRFVAARHEGCDRLLEPIGDSLTRARRLIEASSTERRPAGDALYGRMEETVFTLGPMIAACPSRLSEYMTIVNELRTTVKEQSAAWDMNSVDARSRIYRLLYGARAAVEEVMLQQEADSLPSAIICSDERSGTPAATILGMAVHSGDILVSRGGAPTSALIARGNDYPGNFSHVALVYVDSSSGQASIIESHIERGVAVASIDEYLRDTKLRVMVLRLRADLPAMQRDLLLPHRAASWALETARSRHIPYDFSMDFADSTKWFCSEVVSTAYRHAGLTLWMGLSSISSPGVASWLAAFGVKHFETQEPSDLEYDPQLRVVAEWRDRDALFRDHVDNAVTDAMLEQAERGETLGYRWYALPGVRILKAYSSLLNLFGAVGPVPEGMRATAALVHKRFAARHAAMKEHVLQQAAEFRRRNGYTPPYWELLRFAREVVGGV